MSEERIPFGELGEMPPLFLDYVRDPSRLTRFLPESPSIDHIEHFARETGGAERPHTSELARVLAERQSGWGGDGGGARKLDEGAVAVVTGQQAGLFTGPLYSVLKALTAVKLARELEHRGVPAVPVFWVASEDHDQAEIAWTGILNQDSVFQRVAVAFEDPDDTPVAWLRYPASISDMVETCFASLQPSPCSGEVRDLIATAYRPGVSPVDAFARVLLSLFDGTDLTVIDPMDPEIRRLIRPVLGTALGRNAEVREAVLRQTAAIREAGYTEQVRVDDRFTGLFALEGRMRTALGPSGVASAEPEAMSPNVLLRPVVQDWLLPTSAYVAGPGEIAYFAQAQAAYPCLGLRMPPIFPRISATVLEPPASRTMAKYGLGLADVMGGLDRLRERVIGSSSDGAVFGDVEREIAAQLARLQPVLEGTDATLLGALDNASRKVTHQVATLRSRFSSAAARRNEVLERQLRALVERVCPEKRLQERSVGAVSLLARYGTGLVSMMDERLDLDTTLHQVIEI